MKVQMKDLYHGAALTQIVEHDSFKALNKPSRKYGHYGLNDDTELFMKYCKAQTSPWQFTFNPGDLASIKRAVDASRRVFVCLVSNESVCALRRSDIEQLIDLTGQTQQWVRVEAGGARSRMHVKGSKGALAHAVTHSSFPSVLFENVPNSVE